MLNVGLVGFGFAGQVFHAPVIRAIEGHRRTTNVHRHRAPDPRYLDIDFAAASRSCSPVMLFRVLSIAEPALAERRKVRARPPPAGDLERLSRRP